MELALAVLSQSFSYQTLNQQHKSCVHTEGIHYYIIMSLLFFHLYRGEKSPYFSIFDKLYFYVTSFDQLLDCVCCVSVCVRAYMSECVCVWVCAYWRSAYDKYVGTFGGNLILSCGHAGAAYGTIYCTLSWWAFPPSMSDIVALLCAVTLVKQDIHSL